MKRFLILAMITAFVVPARASAMPDVYAHRGGAALAPENTLGAFEQAHDAYAGNGVWLELDTQLTKDGTLVVIHDDTLDRTTDCTGKVISKTYEEIAPCDARGTMPSWPTREHVPTAEEVLTRGARDGWRLMVEIKNIPGEGNFDPPALGAADALLSLVARTGFPTERLIVQSFWPPALDRIESRSPTIRTALLTTSRLPGAPPNVGFTALENAAYSKARGYDIVAPDDGAPDLSAETVTAIQALGLPVVVWTLDTPDRIARARAWGVDGIITNAPDVAYATLGS